MRASGRKRFPPTSLILGLAALSAPAPLNAGTITPIGGPLSADSDRPHKGMFVAENRLWIWGYSGLHVIDETAAPQSISSQPITAVLILRDEKSTNPPRVFLGTNQGGVSELDPISGHINEVLPDADQLQASNRVLASQDKDPAVWSLAFYQGHLWRAGDQGLFRLDAGLAEPIMRDSVGHLLVSGENLLIATTRALFRLSTDSPVPTRVFSTGGRITKLSQNNGEIWYLFGKDAATYYGLGRVRLPDSLSESPPPRDNRYVSFSEVGGRLWIGAQRGFQASLADQIHCDEIENVNTFFEHDDFLWIGAGEGLFRTEFPFRSCEPQALLARSNDLSVIRLQVFANHLWILTPTNLYVYQDQINLRVEASIVRVFCSFFNTDRGYFHVLQATYEGPHTPTININDAWAVAAGTASERSRGLQRNDFRPLSEVELKAPPISDLYVAVQDIHGNVAFRHWKRVLTVPYAAQLWLWGAAGWLFLLFSSLILVPYFRPARWFVFSFLIRRIGSLGLLELAKESQFLRHYMLKAYLKSVATHGFELLGSAPPHECRRDMEKLNLALARQRATIAEGFEHELRYALDEFVRSLAGSARRSSAAWYPIPLRTTLGRSDRDVVRRDATTVLAVHGGPMGDSFAAKLLLKGGFVFVFLFLEDQGSPDSLLEELAVSFGPHNRYVCGVKKESYRVHDDVIRLSGD